MNIVIITAKGGNQSISNKNLIIINGKTMLAHVVNAARKAKKIDYIFISTECDLIKAEARRLNIDIIDRPPELSTPNANHGDAIIHGAMQAEKKLIHIDTVTILLGNSILLRSEDIDRAVTAVENNLGADSAMTVWKAQDDHPYRAMRITEEGWLASFEHTVTLNTNRQSYPDVFFYDQGPWTVRYSVLKEAKQKKNGPSCWWWMGNKCLPLIRPWVTGKDVHTMLDVAIAEAWVTKKMWEIEYE